MKRRSAVRRVVFTLLPGFFFPLFGALPRAVSAADRAPQAVLGPSVPAGFSHVALFATNSLRVERDCRILSGDLVVNRASPGPTLTPGVELGVDSGATTPSGYSVRADSVRVDRLAVVGGDVASNELENKGVIEGAIVFPLVLPVFGELPAFQHAQTRDGAQPIVVSAGATAVLDPGTYDAVELREDAVLTLTGGTYHVSSITTDKGSAVLFAAAAEVRVSGRVELGQGSLVAPLAGTALGGSELVLYIGGTDGVDGLLGSLPPAVDVGKSSTVEANLYAPFGTVILEAGTHAIGAFLGRDVLVKKASIIELDSHFVNRPPTADPQSVATAGAEPVEITLTGSDPEDQSLSFSIVSDPSFGTLSNLTEIVPDPVTDPDTGETVQPPVTKATVTYTPASADDLEDGFTFAVTDPPGAVGTAVVHINPPSFDEPPPGPPETVVAQDISDRTPQETELLITLTAAAPEGVVLSFAVLTGPDDGLLGPLTPVSEGLVQAATATYTPDPGFVGEDALVFEACGTISGVPVCDTATFFIEVFVPSQEPPDLAVDQEVSGYVGLPTPIDLSAGAGLDGVSQTSVLPPRAAFLDPAEVAGNVADADGDGLGDNSNDLPGESPVLVSAGVDQSGGPGSNGVVRIHAEWWLGDFTVPPGELTGADVLLSTYRGTTDALDTFFYAGGLDQHGTLEDSDFESPLEQLPGVVMPVPDVPVGTEGTFSFSVLPQLKAALEAGFDALVIQGRVDESVVGFGSARGLQVRSSAASNVDAFLQPQLSITTPGATPLIEYTITTLPSHGTLFDSTGMPVLQVGTLLPGPSVTYQPVQGFEGQDQFTFTAQLLATVDTATVTLLVVQGSCEDDKRFCNDGR